MLPQAHPPCDDAPVAPTRTQAGRIRRGASRATCLAAVAALWLAGCAAPPAAPGSPAERRTAPSRSTVTPAAATPAGTSSARPSTPATAGTPAAPAPQPPAPPAGREVTYRVERLVGDAATAGFGAEVAAVLSDPRGWVRARYHFIEDPVAATRIVLAEGPQVDRLCHPYRTGGYFSCQLGRVVALNADRWRAATPQWTAGLGAYRQMLVNHEVGHLLGLHHPRPQCPGDGLPAPVMAQQSTELGACLPNPWPLAWEVDLARHPPTPFAPGYDPAPAARPSPPPADR